MDGILSEDTLLATTERGEMDGGHATGLTAYTPFFPPTKWIVSRAAGEFLEGCSEKILLFGEVHRRRCFLRLVLLARREKLYVCHLSIIHPSRIRRPRVSQLVPSVFRPTSPPSSPPSTSTSGMLSVLRCPSSSLARSVGRSLLWLDFVRALPHKIHPIRCAPDIWIQ